MGILTYVVNYKSTDFDPSSLFNNVIVDNSISQKNYNNILAINSDDLKYNKQNVDSVVNIKNFTDFTKVDSNNGAYFYQKFVKSFSDKLDLFSQPLTLPEPTLNKNILGRSSKKTVTLFSENKSLSPNAALFKKFHFAGRFGPQNTLGLLAQQIDCLERVHSLYNLPTCSNEQCLRDLIASIKTKEYSTIDKQFKTHKSIVETKILKGCFEFCQRIFANFK